MQSIRGPTLRDSSFYSRGTRGVREEEYNSDQRFRLTVGALTPRCRLLRHICNVHNLFLQDVQGRAS